MLVGYPEGAVIYSFKQNKAITSFLYELPPGALGGYPDPSQANGVRYPKLVTAVWHPTGTFILTGHEDESLVFWDPKTGKVIHARTIQSTNVNQRGGGSGSSGSSFIIKAPLFRVAWCAKQNPDDTGILIAGGMPTNVPERGLTFFDLGATPNYQTSSWDILSGHLERPKNKVVLPTPPNTDVVDFCLIPRASPHFAGSYDPIAVIAILGSGEVVTLSFPSGHPISPTNQLHPSLSFVHPFINKVSLASVDRTKWLGLAEKRSAGPPLLRGGAQAKHQLKRFEDRNIIQTAHADGTIRIWDAGDGDEIENEDMIQVDVARALSRQEAVDVATMSMAGAAGELSVGMGTGEVIIFRWDKNKNFGQDARPGGKTEAFGLESIQDHTDPDLKVGFVPLSMFTKRQAPVTALKNSDIGFVAAGFEDGSIIVIDLRGPALIFESSVSDLTKPSKRSSIRKPSGNQHQLKQEWPTSIEFGVMTLEGEGNEFSP